MTTSKNQKHPAATTPGYDPVAALKEVARAMPAAEPMTKTTQSDLRTVERRAPAKFVALVLSAAAEGGGNLAGVAIDTVSSQSDVAQAAQLRVGAATARSIARRLEQQALKLAAGVAQRTLSATASLEAYARTPEGRSEAVKAAELRAAARKPKRANGAAKTKASTKTGPAPVEAPAEAPAAATPVAAGVPAAHGVNATS